MTSIGGCLLFLVLVRRPMSDEVSPRSFLPAHATAGGPANSLETLTSVVAPAAAVVQPSWAAPTPSARTFDQPPAAGVERLRISYRRVRLSSAPDDLRSTELGRLDRGDEVELVDSLEGYLLIRTPTGITGWVQQNALTGGTRATGS
jgi:hypothetical protein